MGRACVWEQAHLAAVDPGVEADVFAISNAMQMSAECTIVYIAYARSLELSKVPGVSCKP